MSVTTVEQGADPDVPVRFDSQFDRHFSPEITVVRVLSVPPGAEPPGGEPPLANTGVPIGSQLLAALLALLVGVALIGAGSRRRRVGR